MKKLIFIFLMLIGWMSGNGQNYVRLGDASGYELSESDTLSVIIATNSLIETFADSLQTKFKVYDVGYYLHNGVMAGELEIENLWATTIQEVESKPNTPYYLIFGRSRLCS